MPFFEIQQNKSDSKLCSLSFVSALFKIGRVAFVNRIKQKYRFVVIVQYVASRFVEQTRQKCVVLVQHVVSCFAEQINQSYWLVWSLYNIWRVALLIKPGKNIHLFGHCTICKELL